MKKLKFGLLVLLFTLAFSTSLVFARDVSEIKVQYVSSLDNTPYSETQDFSVYSKFDRVSVKVNLTTSGTLRTVLRVGSPVVTGYEKKGQGTLWLSRAENGDDVIGQTYSVSSDTKLDYFLDAGVYYIQLQWSCERYDLGMALLFEAAGETTTVQQSTFNAPDKLKLDKEAVGFLTLMSPTDYYSLEMKESALVTFNAAFLGKTGAGVLKLYDSNQRELQFNQAGRALNGNLTYTRYLEPGTYIVTLSGVLGRTTLFATPMYYNVTLEPETLDWVPGRARVKINTTIDYKDIVIVSGTVAEEDAATMATWDGDPTAVVTRKGTTFEVSKNGNYTVRVTDAIGKFTLKTITIDNIDSEPPVVKGVTEGGLYRKAVTLKWSDRDSGVSSAKLNGKTVKNSYKVTKDGKYKLVIKDEVGNETVVNFVKDSKGPKFYGVSKKKTQKVGFVLTVKDTGSGVECCEVNGLRYAATNGQTTLTFNFVGDFTIVAHDKAGNKSTLKLKIKQ